MSQMISRIATEACFIVGCVVIALSTLGFIAFASYAVLDYLFKLKHDVNELYAFIHWKHTGKRPPWESKP